VRTFIQEEAWNTFTSNERSSLSSLIAQTLGKFVVRSQQSPFFQSLTNSFSSPRYFFLHLKWYFPTVFVVSLCSISYRVKMVLGSDLAKTAIPRFLPFSVSFPCFFSPPKTPFVLWRERTGIPKQKVFILPLFPLFGRFQDVPSRNHFSSPPQPVSAPNKTLAVSSSLSPNIPRCHVGAQCTYPPSFLLS